MVVVCRCVCFGKFSGWQWLVVNVLILGVGIVDRCDIFVDGSGSS